MKLKDVTPAGVVTAVHGNCGAKMTSKSLNYFFFADLHIDTLIYATVS